jgi:Domain of unknown function (DUF5753)/Helix-turn-helix domain
VPTPREQLADLLKRSRLDAGIASQGALANRLQMSRSLVCRAENPIHPVPSDVLLAGWAGVTGVPLDQLAELARRAKSTGAPDWFMGYLTAEATATTLRCWGQTLVPGVVQSESYALAVLSVESYTPERLAELVRSRMDRQEVLARAYVTVLIDHLVLQRCIGSPAIMAEQCTYLATMAERPNIAVHVVPEGVNVALWGAFNIASRDGLITVNLTTLRDVTSTATDLVDEALRAYERILGAALGCAESLNFLRTMEEQWKSRI